MKITKLTNGYQLAMVTIKMECRDCGHDENFVYVYKEGREPHVIDKIVCGKCNCVVSRVYRKYVHGTRLKRDDEDDDPLPELPPLIKDKTIVTTPPRNLT